MRTKHYLAFSASALTLLALVLLPALLGAAATSPSGTPPSLQISAVSPGANPNPVAVGAAPATSGSTTTTGSAPTTTGVAFSVNVNDGDEQGESGPITVTNQTYTVSGGGGMITSVSAPEGYTVDTKIPAAGVGTVRITGNSETSFALGVSLYFPQTAAGDDTVTCDGTLTLSNGQTVNSSPSGSAQVAAVAVDSVSLAGSPSSYTIGEAMSRSDFNITTTPSGYGNYQYPETEQYLVTLLPATFNIAVGDNPVVASVVN